MTSSVPLCLEDMTIEVEVVERDHVDIVLMRHWTGDASMSSSGMGGTCEVRFRMAHHVCKLGL
jgi:hypothetical protein